ncbi:bacterial transcriptional activator domain-containing protein [Nocardioides sp. W7]|uniref:bacterial transcriptional activator domain-containing protein n=1 Tax=Nocardioides sp. W7 TaxID=2931390 RepID=UPI001FD12134|nr:bacterial transcriptional activator domain-containing protein [Nocardioides sp. W7]
MTTTSPAPTGPEGVRGPERFAAPAAEDERPSWGKVLGSIVVLLALLVGLPALLVLLTGAPPLPDGLPTKETLTEPLSIDAVFAVLRVVVWLAWLQFALCTAVEVVSLLRGGGLPRPVPLSGHSQALARALVGTILIGASVLGSSGAASAADDARAVERASTVAVQQTQDTDQAQDGAVAQDQVAEAEAEVDDAPRMKHVPGVPRDMTDVIGKKVAIVQPPSGHYHDNLWDIAERHLDDGRRWKEIFDLNKGRAQPDGLQLELGRLIQPGWVLIMPGDAHGVQRVQALEQHAPEQDQGGSGGASTVVDRDQVEETGADESAVQEAAPLLLGGLLSAMLAGAAIAERRRRRGLALGDDDLEAEVTLRIGSDEERVRWLDRALRGLSATCRAERVPLPQVYAATVSDDAVELRVAPPVAVAPAPWSVLDGGSRWRLDRDAEEPAESGHAPYPGLVCLGRDDHGTDVLLDLESVAGAVTVTGSPTVAREVVSALAVQLATAPWADDQRIWAYDLAPVLADVAGSPLLMVDDLTGHLNAWQRSSPARRAQEVLGGRLGRHPGAAPEYLVLGGLPGIAAGAQLDALGPADTRGLGVLSAVPVPGARWRLGIDDSGRLSIPLLDLEVDAVRLTADAADDLAALFTKVRTDTPLDVRDRISVPVPPHDHDDSHWRSAPIRVGVLGPLELRSAGQLDPARLDLATEVVVFLALQSAPVHPSVVGASVWPRGVTAEVRDATIARVRDWLGDDRDGNALLRETPEGRLHLAPDVAVDWHAFCVLARRARESDVGTERELLRRALQLVRGELIARRPVSRYSWLPRTRLERQAVDVVVDAAHRLAELSFDDDPAGATAACQAGLRLAPTSQVLWRDLLIAEDRNPDGPGTSAVVDEMVRALQTAKAPLEAETEALVIELLPHRPEGEVSA